MALHLVNGGARSQKRTRMRPRRPYLVHRSRGRNHSTSSGVLNIQRTTALFLCTLTGKPVSTIFFRLMRSGSLLRSVPTAAPVICVNFHLKGVSVRQGAALLLQTI